MPVSYFNAHHTQSNQSSFGLYDDPDPAKNPAYILENERDKWIGIVENPQRTTAHFYGIDNDLTVRIFKDSPRNREPESNCDGMLHYENCLSFVELKERQGSGWLRGATDQLINTIRLFAEQQSLDGFDDINAFICNSMRPKSNGNHTIQMQRFSDETAYLNFKGSGTGLKMDVSQTITI